MSIEIKAWKCEQCEKAYLNKMSAEDCCKEKPKSICRICGIEVEKYRTICSNCLNKERYEKAKKIKYSEYKIGCLWDEKADKYFFDKDELEEDYYNNAWDDQDCAETKEEPIVNYPEWCYGCVEIPFKIGIDSALERASEDMYEDFDYDRDIVDLKGLYDFVEQWNEKQTTKAYSIDYSTVVLLNE